MVLILSMVGIMTGCVCAAVAGVVFLFGVADELVSEDKEENTGGPI